MVESCSTSLPGGDQVDDLPPAVSSRVIRELGELAPRRRQRKCIKSWDFFAILSKIHMFNFSDTCFMAQFNYVL